ncbi:transcriptional regulator, XRE family with cupin sensor [Streptoalloteichus tenebrarius]|uniref:Transcriptional regulator, XRE family with cupin sensor n=1 Tax=Streptoalloteichus tenebrarius (strain ATCC 17920 / DSM 40477 / JCM 4838 / CBS 697.72 / NBRC 16177 / NCIMB 11028 / NRRL B-12390 / A12253. 1 / ISP 5477) TaxID=1933 RepID=A0ABT1I1C3_STRSD|nr:XRE family transcriptional regulator [Streptoalloteichus tenebrarius]MCP2261588.1 transcriptional regulator, XRE family with cupin sensor [Streptoalloteichus tenebrarius]BFE99412.1 XRE family transcriptional regulator [Streptoalloteichus tenebrarius]
MEKDFGAEVRRLRQERQLTLDELAERSGVSRAALSKIERGERNPSLHSALQIAEALGRPLSELVGYTAATPTVVRGDEVSRMVDESTGAVREALLEPVPGSEIIRYTLPPRSAPAAFRPHPPGTRESFVVLTGTLRVTAGETTVELHAGDAAVLPGDRVHRLSNPGDTEAVFLLLVLRPRA